MSAEPQITQAEMDKYFETAGKEAPAALVEAEKQETIEQVEQPKVEVKPEVKPETKPEVKADGEVQVQVEGKTVPLAELIAERKARQEWQSTAAAQQQQLTEALKLAQERAKLLSPEDQAKAPNPTEDPQGFAVWEYEQLKKQVTELKQGQQQTIQERQAQEVSNRVLNWAQAQQQAFVEQQKDYPEAYKFARTGREAELKAFGLSPMEIQQTIDAEQAQVIQRAAMLTAQGNPTNPAKLVYDYAKARGYKAEIVAEQKKVPDLDDKVKTIAKGQEAAKGMSTTSGGAPSEINNLADLAAASSDMTDEEFSKAFDKIAPKMKGKYV